MNKLTKQLKKPTNLATWISNAITVLGDESITSKDLDKMFKENDKLDLQCITNNFNELGISVSHITQYVIGSGKFETIKSLKTSNSDDAKQTYEQLSKLKRLYRAKKALSGAGLRIKWHKEYITKALKLKWSIGKPKSSDGYTDNEINTYAGILGNNLRLLDDADKAKSEKLPNGSSYTTLEKLTDALTNTNTNTKDKKDVLSKTLNILNAMKEKSDKRRLIGLKGKLKDTNPVYFALFNEKTTKFTYEKIKKSIEKIQQQPKE